MFNKNQILDQGKFKKRLDKIQVCTATAMGRTGVVNKAGIDDKAYVIMLRGNLASGDGYDNS